MLKWRILTACFLIPLVLGGILTLQPFSFALVSMGLFLIGAWEWAGLCHYSMVKRGLFLCTFILIGMGFAYWDSPWILGGGTVFWLLPLGWVCCHTRIKQTFLPVIGIIILSTAWYALNALYRTGAQWVILLLILIWSTDTFAYFAGKKWGKHAFVPLISPNKTVEGFWGGVLGALLIALFCKIWVPLSWPLWLSVAYLVVLLSILGDLFESFVKRLSGVKDSGKWLPGHGGLLDRIDSLLAALPFYALSLYWLTK